MAKLNLLAAALLAASAITLGAAWTFRLADGAEPPAPAGATAGAAQNPSPADDRKPKDDPFPLLHDVEVLKERTKDFIMATIGNMRPVIHNEKGVWFQSRQAILYKDGTVKLWDFEQRPPVAGPLRHKGPIKSVDFFNELKLLVTTSDGSIKFWDGLTGEPRAELDGQMLGGSYHSCSAEPCPIVTIDSDHRIVTLWDPSTFKPAATFRAEGPRLITAALAKNGRTLATFAEDRSIELRDVTTGQTFATLRPPSPVAEVFAEDGKSLQGKKLSYEEGSFWKAVQTLAPADRAPKEE